MPSTILTSSIAIDPSSFCPGCYRLTCACSPPLNEEALYDEHYARGYEACQTDGYDNHPLACRASNEPDAALARDWMRLVSGGSLLGIDGKRFYGSHWFRSPTRGRDRGLFGHHPLRDDLWPEATLAGWDDAGAGLSSAVDEPERHAICAAQLNDYEQILDASMTRLTVVPNPSPVI